MRTFITAVIAAACVAFPGRAQAQTLTTEFDLTGGYSSQDQVKAAAAQLRLFGEAGAGIRFNVEGIWAGRSNDATDAFGAVYPYGGRVQVSEAYAERTFQFGSGLLGVRAGQFRTPFGISSRSDYAYSGYLRAPLIRYEGYWAINNNFLERGVDAVLGTSRLSVEVSLAAPGDLGADHRRPGLDRVVRAQGYYRALIVGASHIDSVTYGDARYAAGRMNFNGVDGRFTLNGVQVSGEFLHGQPWNGPTTTGWYLDATLHRPFMGPVTAVFRIEQLDYHSPHPFTYRDESGFTEWRGRRQTVGGRVRLPGGFTAQAGVIRPSSELGEYSGTALDVALTYSVRR
jgi:hypothetical protein